MKRALVLSGGGSRGAYECGAWQALCELNIRLDAVYGTSIGALNAALVAQGSPENAARLWDTISIGKIIATDDDEDFSVEHMFSGKWDVIPFLLENAKNFGADITPMENLLREHIDEGRVRASGMELGVMLTKLPALSPVEMRLRDIPLGRLNDYLIASASCFPVFPVKEIGEDKYIDGGYCDNMPIGMAIKDGADEIIGIDIHPQPTHPQYGSMPFLKLIHPLHDLGNFLDFNPALLRRSRMLGYYDTMKAYGRFDGIRYTFRRVNELQVADAARRYLQMIALFDARSGSRGSDAVLIGALGAETPLRTLSWKDTLLRGLELCAQTMGFREDAIYDVNVLNGRLLKFVRGLDDGEKPGDRGISEAARAGERTLTAYLYNAMRRDASFIHRYAKRLADYPMETAAAMYLYCADNR